MNKVYFALALHFHQPIGNFDHVIERAYQFCYRPFLEALLNHPEIKINIHVSGPLLDYLNERHPEAIKMIQDMSSRGQLEIMAGAYYEAILPSLPERDAKGQIKMMLEYIKKNFGVTPKGMWIAERVWEPYLAGLLYEVGIRYTILDDTHFFRSGVTVDKMHGYYLTGMGDKRVAVFPSDKKLRYSIPFDLPEKTVEYFKEISQKSEHLLFTYGDDGEKFGEWPGTHKWVYEDGWLIKFFNALIENRDWIELVRLSDYLEHNKETGIIDLKSGSYEEMMEWSHNSWMNFLEIYPETRQMHRKMIYVSEKINSLRPYPPEQALVELYKGQCNCGWWHGVFGGLYLYHLRRAVYHHLINADRIVDGVLHKNLNDWLEVKEVVYNKDGRKYFVLESNIFSVYIDQNDGGVIKELDYRPISINLVNTLSRKKESYHQKILEGMTKDDGKVKTIHDDAKPSVPGLSNKLIYDKFPRNCLRDYFLRRDITIDDFMNSRYDEIGGFTSSNYVSSRMKEGIVLKAISKVSGVALKVQKQIQIKPGKKELFISYDIERLGPRDVDAIFGIEFNFTMPDLNSDRYDYFCNEKAIGCGLSKIGQVENVESFGIIDYNKECGLRLNFLDRAREVWYFPVETVSQSERSYELNYQCSCIFPRWPLDFSKNNTCHLEIIWAII